MKRAFITGVAGQDGSYLAEFLLNKGYEVHGLVRRNASAQYPNIEHIRNDITLHHGDLTDSAAINSTLSKIKPDEIYNLAAQSHIKISFDMPVVTTDINAIGPLRILDTMRMFGLHGKMYQASTSEMLGNKNYLIEKLGIEAPMIAYPGSPYGAAKLYAYWITVNYRESYNIFASNGILYNHESPRRGEMFVTRKITKAFANMVAGKQDVLELGNLDSLRDWGHAKDYVRAMWLILQQDKPDDYTIATGKQASIRDFCNLTARYFDIDLVWEGSGVDEVAKNAKTGKVMIRVNKDFFRPVDIVNLIGDTTKARNELGWMPEYDLQGLVNDMCENDFKNAQKGA
jgi:GDPmannose 4,6-dehydratase